jgi:hypothetical protein
LVWNALAQQNQFGATATDSTVTEFEARLIMSIVGTVIVFNKASDAAAHKSPASVKFIPPIMNASKLENIIGLDGVTTLSGFEIYQCYDGGSDMNDTLTSTNSSNPDPARTNLNSLQCLNVGTSVDVASTAGGGQNFKSMLQMVTERMTSINTSLTNETPMSAADKGFVNATSLPVYKMIAVANAYKGNALAQSVISGNSKIIAAEYSAAYLEHLMEVLNQSIVKYKDKAGAPYAEATAKIQERIIDIRKINSVALTKLYSEHKDMLDLSNEVANMEKVLMSTLPNSLSGSMSMRRLH